MTEPLTSPATAWHVRVWMILWLRAIVNATRLRGPLEDR
jgi:hypothetical protein